jgi:hypothetical protein
MTLFTFLNNRITLANLLVELANANGAEDPTSQNLNAIFVSFYCWLSVTHFFIYNSTLVQHC